MGMVMERDMKKNMEKYMGQDMEKLYWRNSRKEA